ncbi:GPCR fungal pheromone mating factor [Xylariales sp. PMI_506]|nr:GPCR fungal pheromone mating factor [Xylariales sp. PMI_506]
MAPTPTLIPAITPAVAAVAAASTTHFDPKTQIFYIAGPDGIASIPIAMSVIDLQRVRLASICISYGVQLGLCLMTLVMLLLLIPLSKLRKPINALNMLSLVTALVRLCLLVGYFPGPLSEYYVAWTRDARALQRTDYSTNTAGNASNVLQFTLIEISLILQTWKLMATWSDLWQWIIKSVSVGIAVATIVVKSLWCVHHTDMLRDRTLPLGLDVVGEVATIMGAASIFYFCGIFFANLMMHLDLTRGVLRRPRRGLSSLEILAIGHGTLMFLPSKTYPHLP